MIGERRPHPLRNSPWPTVDVDGLAVPSTFAARHVPTKESRQQVQTMSSLAIPQPIQARISQINLETLRKHYRDELDLGLDRATLQVGSKVLDIALRGPIPEALKASMFWLRNRARNAFKEATVHELSGPDGTPIETKAI